MQNINVVAITGNLTKDPDQKKTPSGTYVTNLRVAVNSARKDAETGEWVEKANYIDVAVFGNAAKSCAEYLQKGRPVAVQGRLDWNEWEAKDGSGTRQAVKIIASSVQFLGTGKAADEDEAESSAETEAGEGFPEGGALAGVGASEEDISF